MKRIYSSLFWMGIVLILAVTACNPSAPSSAPELPAPTETAVPATEAPPTETPPPSPTPEEDDTETPPTEEINRCTVLQNLNLRTGPGLAYHTPIGVIPEDTVVEPVSYYPVGVPGGTWILIEETDDHPSGWIAAGENFINCDFDLDTLPAVQVDDPPPPLAPRSIRSSEPEGGCGPKEDYQCDVIITDESLVQFKIFQNGKELTEKNNITKVTFSVRRRNQSGKEVYSTTENNSAYCIFGGDQPCNSWEVKNNAFHWPGGPALEPGKYFIEILAHVDENGSNRTVRWAAQFTLELP